jgi:hypothetical protein
MLHTVVHELRLRKTEIGSKTQTISVKQILAWTPKSVIPPEPRHLRQLPYLVYRG